MAPAAVQAFKDMIEADCLRAEQEVMKQRVEAERRQAMLDLADRFQSSVGGVVRQVEEFLDTVLRRTLFTSC